MVDKSGQVDKQAKYLHAGERFTLVREFRSVRQKILAEKLDIATDTVKKWQQRGVPKKDILKLAIRFKVPEYVFSKDFQITEEGFKSLLRRIDNGEIEVSVPIKTTPSLSGLPYENEDFPWDEVISGAGDEGQFHFYIGSKCNAEGNFDQAIFNLNKALATGTLDSQLLHDAYSARGYSWYKKNDLKKALTDYVESLAPESISAPIPPAYDKALNRPYKRPRFSWYDEDVPLKETNDLDATVKNIPASATLHYLRGLESVELGEYDAAIDDIKAAIELDPQSVHMADFLSAKGYVLFQERRYQEAVTVFSLVVDEKFNDGPEVLYFRALAYEKLNQSSDSIKDIEKCLEIDPNNELFLEKYRALN